VAIVQCTHCPRYYWSFRSDFPPKGYCSQKCYDERRRAGAKLPPPEAPQNILMAMYRHRLDTHESTSILADFECEECERLEGSYAESLSWHQAAAERELRQAEQTERRKPKTVRAVN
jgi:hypothetical protein